MLKTRSKRPKLKTDLSLRIRGVCQDSTLTHEIFDNYYFGSKRLEKHCNPTSNWVYDAHCTVTLSILALAEVKGVELEGFEPFNL